MLLASLIAAAATTIPEPETVVPLTTQIPTVSDVVTADLFFNHMECIEHYLLFCLISLLLLLGFFAGLTLFRWLK